MKSKAVTAFCKICFSPINDHNFSTLFTPDSHICDKCYRTLNINFEKEVQDDLTTYYLSHYTETIKSLIYHFKGLGDIELSSVFFERTAKVLHHYFRSYVLIPVPSSKEGNEKRGFNHVVEMFKPLNLPIIHCLKKIKDIKQADLSKEERMKVKNNLMVVNGEQITGKKLLIIDDIKTTGSSLLASKELLLPFSPKKVLSLVFTRTMKKSPLSDN